MSNDKSDEEGREKDQSKAKGGFARAEVLSPAARSEIAKRAAEARWQKIPKATHDGEIRIGEIVIPCAVLEDGTRVLSQRGFTAALGGGRPSSRQRSGGGNLPVILSAKNLKPFIDEDLTAAAAPIAYYPVHGGRSAFGIPAEVVPKMCKVWIRAAKVQKLTPQQEPFAEKAEILVHGFAEVGITALVDEATGYQEVRDREALQQILDRFLRKEFAAWAKTFPDEFYRQIFRLRGWKWMGMTKNRPQCVAAYTKDLVYSRLAPGILKELESKNPLANGRRKAAHFQWLTEDIGHPALAQHLHAVIGFMRASESWDELRKLVNRAFPKREDTKQMKLFTEEDL